MNSPRIYYHVTIRKVLMYNLDFLFYYVRNLLDKLCIYINKPIG